MTAYEEYWRTGISRRTAVKGLVGLTLTIGDLVYSE